MKPIASIFAIIFNFTLCSVSAQYLNSFGAETGKQERDGFIQRKAYNDIVNYYGYIKTDSVPDDIREGKSLFYLYFYLKDSVAEIGVRIVTPVPLSAAPNKNDIVASNYYVNEKDKSNTFNSWLALERAYSVKGFSDIAEQFYKTGWLQLGYNDDCGEMFNKTNSIVRIINSPKKPIVPGLYRIVIASSTKEEEVKGGFLIQLGSTARLTGVKLVTKVEDLHP